MFSVLGVASTSAADLAIAESAAHWEIGIEPNYAYVVLDDQSEVRGGGGVIHLRYDLSESVAIRLSASYTAHDLKQTEDGDGGTLQVFAANAGLTYALDVLRISPKIEVGLGVLHSIRPDSAGTDFGVLIGLGVDYAVNAWFTAGGALHYHGFITDLNNLPVYVTLGPRVAFRF